MPDDEGRPRDPALDDLQRRIDTARGPERAEAARGATTPPAGLSAALRLSTELLAGVVVGGGLGYFLDRWLGSSPFALIAFVLIGFAAGTVNLIRAAARPGRSPTPPGSGDRG